MSKSTLASFKISNPHRTIQSIYDHNSCIVLACFLQNMLIFSEVKGGRKIGADSYIILSLTHSLFPV